MDRSDSSSNTTSTASFDIDPDVHYTDLYRDARFANKKQYKGAPSASSFTRYAIPGYPPIIEWAGSYKLSDFVPDFIAGLTVTSILIPQAISYATNIVKVNAIIGMYSGCIPLFVYAIFGTARHLGAGPNSVGALLTGNALAPLLAAGTPYSTLEILSVLTLLVGIVSLLMGICRIDFIDSVFSRPLLAGLVNGIAVAILVLQFPPMLGIDLPSDTPALTFVRCMRRISDLNWMTAAMSGCCLMFLHVSVKLKDRFPHNRTIQLVPTALILVILATIIAGVFRLDRFGLKILGAVKTESTSPSLPSFKLIFSLSPTLLPTAFMITLMCFTEAIVSARIIGRIEGYSVSPNRELIAYGWMNIVGCFFHCMPSLAGITRGKVCHLAGGRTQLSIAITGLMVGFILLFAMPLLYFLPMAELAALIFFAGIGLVTTNDLCFCWRMRAWSDIAFFSIAFMSVIFFTIQDAMMISAGLSLLLMLRHMRAPRLSLLGRVAGQQKFAPLRECEKLDFVDGVLLVRFDESLFFVNASRLKEQLCGFERFDNVKLAKTFSTISTIVFDLSSLHKMDTSALQVFVEIVEGYRSLGQRVLIVKLPKALHSQFEQAGLFELIGSMHFFSRMTDAVRFAHNSNPPIEVISMPV